MIRRLTLGVLLGTAVLIAAEPAGRLELVYLAKPATTLLIGLIAWVARPADPRYRRRVLAGLTLSLVGDVFLMVPGNWFVPGLASFLAAHLAYIAAFTAGRAALGEWRPLVPLALFGIGYLAVLWPGLGGLRVPVTGYLAAIVTMGWQANARALDFAGRGARWAAIGSVCFVASDALLAWNRFRAPFSWAGPAITVTYVMAQWLIARSVEADAPVSTASS